MSYEDYSDLLNRKYVEGDQDCYGLVMAYYRKTYGMELTNYARPDAFHEAGLDLIGQHLKDEGFEIVEVNLSKLQKGDGLLFQVAGSNLCNHLGVYVGNQYFLHHLWNGVSIAEAMTVKWKSRVLTVVRHPEITAKNMSENPIKKLIDFLPEDMRARYDVPQ